jgi:S-DNA-T family DNA segregation ATPase FtsK/SpoIIIE
VSTTDNGSDTGRGDLARVHYLPAHTDQPADAIEGEIITEEEYRRLTSQKAQAIARYQGYRRDIVTVGRVVRTVAFHDRTKTAVKASGRHLWYPIAGTGVVVKRWRDTHGANRYERMMRQAEIDGNHDRLLEWEARDVAEKQRRHDRVMDWVKSPLELAKATGLALVSVAALLLVLGFILWVGGNGSILGPIEAVIEAIAFTVWFFTAYGALLLTGGTAAGVAYLWHVGRTRTTAPTWFAPAAKPGEVVNLTPSIVVAALRDLGIKVLRDAIKADPDMGARMLGPITRYGDGAQVAITLPPQVTGNHIIKARETLAGNLDRKVHEVHIERSEDSEREFTLWVADSGALDRKLPPSPLLDEEYGPVDLYRDTMPWGTDIKGDPVALNLLQQHLLLSGCGWPTSRASVTGRCSPGSLRP